MSDQQTPRAPAGLQTAGKRFWRSIHATYEVANPGEVVLLELASRALDTCDRLAAVVDRDGVTAIGSTGQQVVHPAVAELRHQRKLVGDLLRQLGLPDPDELPNYNPPRRRNRPS